MRSDSRRAHRWLPWLVGAVAIGLFVTGGVLSAARGGHLSRIPGFGLATRTLAAFAGAARDQGTFVGSYALAAEAHLNKPPQTVIIGPADDHRTAALAEAAWRTFRPGRMVAAYDPGTVALDSLPPAVAGAARVFGSDPTPRAYVCVGETCAPPTTEPAQVAESVRDYGRVGPR